MSEYQTLLLDKQEGIAFVSMNRPAVLNALNETALYELDKVIEEIENDSNVLVVIITGNGDKAFVAGADIGELRYLSALQARNWSKYGQSVFNKLENLPKPVIAAINGYALGGGCELAMSCDIRIASEKARLGLPEVLLGVIPGYAGTQRLPRLIGKGRAKELLFTGEQIDAKEAHRIGLVNKVVPHEQLLNAAKDMAFKIMSRGQIAIKLVKSAINEGIDVDFETAQSYEAEVFGLSFSTEDQKEGMAAFMEKRDANFKGK